jgi:hypothetical protein
MFAVRTGWAQRAIHNPCEQEGHIPLKTNACGKSSL